MEDEDFNAADIALTGLIDKYEFLENLPAIGVRDLGNNVDGHKYLSILHENDRAVSPRWEKKSLAATSLLVRMRSQNVVWNQFSVMEKWDLFVLTEVFFVVTKIPTAHARIIFK